jgi:hypothetical protein
MALTQESLIEMARKIRGLEVAGKPELIISPLAFTTKPVKRYPRRRARSEAHYERMFKKWAKRYGVVLVPRMYYMNCGGFLARGPHLVCHPLLAAQARAALEAL